MESSDSALRYIDAERLGTSAGPLHGVVLVGPADETLGRLDGMLISPLERQVRYYVVGSRRWFTTRHYLMPAVPAQLDASAKALRVDVDADELQHMPEIDPDTLPPFSDSDLLDAMFARAR